MCFEGLKTVLLISVNTDERVSYSLGRKAKTTREKERESDVGGGWVGGWRTSVKQCNVESPFAQERQRRGWGGGGGGQIYNNVLLGQLLSRLN